MAPRSLAPISTQTLTKAQPLASWTVVPLDYIQGLDGGDAGQDFQEFALLEVLALLQVTGDEPTFGPVALVQGPLRGHSTLDDTSKNSSVTNAASTESTGLGLAITTQGDKPASPAIIQRLADELDRETIPRRIEELNHFRRFGSSSDANEAETAFNNSLVSHSS